MTFLKIAWQVLWRTLAGAVVGLVIYGIAGFTAKGTLTRLPWQLYVLLGIGIAYWVWLAKPAPRETRPGPKAGTIPRGKPKPAPERAPAPDPPGVPPVVGEFIAQVARDQEFVAWWTRAEGDPNCVLTWHPALARYEITTFPAVVGHWGHDTGGAAYAPDEILGALALPGWAAPAAVVERVTRRLRAA